MRRSSAESSRLFGFLRSIAARRKKARVYGRNAHDLTETSFSNLNEEYSNPLSERSTTLSLLTNYAAGISKTSLTHEEVLENAKKSTNKMVTLLSEIVKKVKT